MSFIAIWTECYRATTRTLVRCLAVLFLWPCSAYFVPARGQTAPAIPAAYRLQPGDSFTVMYRLTPEYNQTVSVQPGGEVTLQLTGTINLRDDTLAEATEVIRALASRKLRNPDVSLELKDFLRPHFLVLGEVASPGRYELRGSMTVTDALALAGGLKLSARHTNIILIKPINAEIGQTQLINFKALEKRKGNVETRSLPALESGDIIIVPTSKLSQVERYVKVVNAGIYYNPISR